MIINNTAPLLVESAWEVCNQVGGIYTVIRSKVPSMVERWGDRYLLLGPYVANSALAEFEPIDDYDSPIGQSVLEMRQAGMDVHLGYWLVSGRPKVVLFNVKSIAHLLPSIRHELYSRHQIPTPESSELHNNVIAFGYMSAVFMKHLSQNLSEKTPLVMQIHEWMAGSHIPDMRYWKLPVKVVFTTHATQLGRYIAGNDPDFYVNLPKYDWRYEAKYYGVESAATIEYLSAQHADILTTVSDITGAECEVFLGRKPEIITPNGLNIERFAALHEFQNLHKEYKDKINQFVIGHFFHSYKFDLENTLYFFISGRYEYTNKGFDIMLVALSRLNDMMKRYNVNKTVVAFFITKRPVHTINPVALQSRAMLEEIKGTVDAITRQLRQRLYMEVVAGTSAKLPPLNDMIDDYWRLRLRRTIQAWKTKLTPIVVTHILQDDQNDEILNYLRASQLLNYPEDKVKIVYHPDFIMPSNPLFGMDYGQFVRGAHLGVFPSYYEPWGYTPLECLASGIPSITSDLSGFGDYVMKNVGNYQAKGISVVRRYKRTFEESANELTDQMFAFVQKSLRERIEQRNYAESTSEEFDWRNLGKFYEQAYQLALNPSTKKAKKK